MKRAPSVERLIKYLGLDRAQAETVRGLIKGAVDPESVEQTAKWIRQCYHRPSDPELVIHAIDATIGTCGVEGLGPVIDRRFTPHYCYCNTGDTYAPTIIQNNVTGSYFIGSWGDVVEREGY